MSTNDKIIRKLHSAFKLSGFPVRREFCVGIIGRLTEEHVDVQDSTVFERNVKLLCESLERQCLNAQSIEKEHVERALEACLSSGLDSNESVFSCINAFDFPRLFYEIERKTYIVTKKKPTLLGPANSRTQLFLDRYNTIFQRAKRIFKGRVLESENDRLSLQTVDYLIIKNRVKLNTELILGSLLQVSVGKYFLEDPTGRVQLDFTHATFHTGLFPENSFVLVNGLYDDKVLQVSTVLLPPGEEYKESKPFFRNYNYFGGPSVNSLRDSSRLKEHMMKNPDEMIFFFSDVWLDYPMTFEKLSVLFQGLNDTPPIALVFMGTFLSDSCPTKTVDVLKKLFKKLGDLIGQFQGLAKSTEFIFVPSMSDPCSPHIIPRLPLPRYIKEDMVKNVPKLTFATNPCRLQFCTREIVIFRADIFAKLMQATIHKPKKEDLAEALTRTIISQGHLSPLPLNALPVHWEYDYCLRLYPLPDLIVIGDKCESYEGQYKGSRVVNPGSFCDYGFQFKSYMPYPNTVDDCQL